MTPESHCVLLFLLFHRFRSEKLAPVDYLHTARTDQPTDDVVTEVPLTNKFAHAIKASSSGENLRGFASLDCHANALRIDGRVQSIGQASSLVSR